MLGGGRDTDVPKKLHFIWMGGELSDSAKANLEQWAAKAAGSGWRVRLWTDPAAAAEPGNQQLLADLESKYPGVVGQRPIDRSLFNSVPGGSVIPGLDTNAKKLFDLAHDKGAYAMASDIARYHILNKRGGAYVDVDIAPGGITLPDNPKMSTKGSSIPFMAPRLRDQEALQRELAELAKTHDLSNLTDQEKLKLASDKLYSEGQFNNNLIVSPPNSQFLKRLIDNLPKPSDRGVQLSMAGKDMSQNAAALTGPLFIENQIQQHLKSTGQWEFGTKWAQFASGDGLRVDQDMKNTWGDLELLTPESEAQLDRTTPPPTNQPTPAGPNPNPAGNTNPDTTNPDPANPDPADPDAITPAPERRAPDFPSADPDANTGRDLPAPGTRSPWDGPSPEQSLDFTPGQDGLTPAQQEKLDSLAKDLAETTVTRDDLGFQPARVDITGFSPDVRGSADAVRDFLDQRIGHHLDAQPHAVPPEAKPVITVTGGEGGRPGADVDVDWELKRPETHPAPEPPAPLELDDTAPPVEPKKPEPTPGERILADESWRHSPKDHSHPDASWTKHPNPVGPERIDAVRDQVPPVRHASESGGLTNSSEITTGPDGRPRFNATTWGGDIGFEVRRIEFPGKDGEPGTVVQDRTFRLHIENPGDFTPDQLARFESNAKQGMRHFWNEGGFQLPRGDQLNQHIEFTTDPDEATGRITITPPGTRPDLTHLPIDATPAHFAHEIGGHSSGLDDAYFEKPDEDPRVFQHSKGKVVTHLDGTTEVVGKGRVTNDSGLMGPNAGRPDAHVMPRDLWVLDKRGPDPDSVTPVPAREENGAPTTTRDTPPADTRPTSTPATDTRPAEGDTPPERRSPNFPAPDPRQSSTDAPPATGNPTPPPQSPPADQPTAAPVDSPQPPNAPRRHHRGGPPPVKQPTPTTATPAQQVKLDLHGVVPVTVGGATRGDSLVAAIRETLGPKAPPALAQLPANPDDAQVAQADVRVHVLLPNGEFQSFGPVTGVPVHVVQRDTPDGPRFDATREDVHIGRPGVVYAGPTVVTVNGVKHTFHRGEFEIETIAGRHHVRMYTAVVNPATFPPDASGRQTSPFKDIQQNPTTGELAISPGNNGVLWAGGGRPQRAIQWLKKYEHTDGGKPIPNSNDVIKPVLRSFLVPLEVFDRATRTGTVEHAPDKDAKTYNVDQRGEPNQFGVNTTDLEALINEATPGSLITYSPEATPSFANMDQAGRIAPVSDLYDRLGLPADFRSDAAGKDFDPWFSWTRDKSGNWDIGFQNNPQRLHDIAVDLREHHVTYEQAKQDPAQRTPNAVVEPDTETAPTGGPKDPEGAKDRDTGFDARFERLNRFLNSVGPPSVNVAEVATEVLNTAPGVLTERLQSASTPPTADVAALQDVVKSAVVGNALDAAVHSPKSGLDKAVRVASGGNVPKTRAEFARKVDEGFRIGGRKQTFDAVVVDPLVDAFVDNVKQHDALRLLDDASRARVADLLKDPLRDAVKAELADLGPLGAVPGAGGKKAGWLSGPRLRAFEANVVARVTGRLPAILPNTTPVAIDSRRLADVAQQDVLGPVVDQALRSFTGQDLTNTPPAELKESIEDVVLPTLSAEIESNLRDHPALALADRGFRESIARDVAREAAGRSAAELAGFTFTPVDPAEVDAFMARIPALADQAEIGALLAADSDRIAIDFNTREQADGPFPNDYAAWREGARAEYLEHVEVGKRLDEAINAARGAGGRPDARPVVDRLIGEFPELENKFREVATKNQKEPYRPEGAKDSFTFYEHAQMVLGQYLDLTRSEQPADRFISTDAMAKAILFHDIEKNNAKNQFGDGKGRHDAEPEHKLAVQVMDRYAGLWNNPREFEAVRSIVDSDPIGFYLRGELSAEQTFAFIHDLAERIGDPNPPHPDAPVSPEGVAKLFQEFHQYYQADFSSYTEYSGYTDEKGNARSGPPHFNQYFATDGDGLARTPDQRHFRYSSNPNPDRDYAAKIAELEAMFADPARIPEIRERIREAERSERDAALGVRPRPGTPDSAYATPRPGTPDSAYETAPTSPARGTGSTPPNAPPGNVPPPSTPPTDTPAPAPRAVRGPAPELSLDLPSPELDARHGERLDALAADVAETNAVRDRTGYRPAVVEVSGPRARAVVDALAARGVEATVRDTAGTSTDVHVDWDLKRPEGWTPPPAPVGAKVTDTTITSPAPADPHPVLDDPSWRHSTAPTADWFTPHNPATGQALQDALANLHNTPVTSYVRGEDGGLMTTTVITPDGIRMQPWRGPIAYDTRVLNVNGTPVRVFTVKLHLDRGTATDAQITDLEERAEQGVNAFYNQGNRLPGGEQIHVTVEFPDNPADAHATITVAPPSGRANQLTWPVDTDPATLGHEIGHFLGQYDEYYEPGEAKPVFQDKDGRGRVVNDNAPMTAGYNAPDATLKPRNLWLIENRMRALESFNVPQAETTSRSASDPQPPNAPWSGLFRSTPAAQPPANPAAQPPATTTPRPPANPAPQPPANPAAQPPATTAPIPLTPLGNANHAGARPMPAPTPAPAPTPVLASRNLPDFFQHNKALGTIAATRVRGAADVTAAITGIDPADAAVVESAIEGDFESFLGQGRNFQVRIGDTWYEANVKAAMRPPADEAAATTTPPLTTKVDMATQSAANTGTSTNLTTANDVGLAATASAGVGPYGSLGGKAQLATPATTLATSSGTVDQRAIRSGESSTHVDVPVTFTVTLTSADGAVRGPHTVDGEVALQVPDDLETIAGSGNAKPAAALPPGWGAKLEHPVPEAVVDVDSAKAFAEVAAKLHPSIVKVGAPGRTALQDFLSPTSIRDNLGAMLAGWVTSPDLISPHGGKGAAVQVRASLLTAELVGTHGSAELRLHEHQATASGVSGTTKSGFDATAGVGGGVGVPDVVGGAAGVTAGYSARTSETAPAGTGSTTRTGIQLKGDTGLYRVTANVLVRTPNGADVVVPVTTYLRVGLPEAAALGLPVPDGAPASLTKPGTAGTKHLPPYLAAQLAAGNIKVGEFGPGAEVQQQVESVLRGLPGFDGFLPGWNTGANPRKGAAYADVAEAAANQRKLEAELSATALKAKMDSLLGPGVQVRLKKRGLRTNEYVNITVKARPVAGSTRHLGRADARNVRGAAGTSPRLDSTTATQKAVSVGVEGKVVVPAKTGAAVLTPTPQVGAKYTYGWGSKNTGGPAVSSTALNVGSPNAQVFGQELEFVVEVTTFTRNRSWVKRLTPGSPFLEVPKPKVVARTGGAEPGVASLDRIAGPVHLWVSDSSAMDHDPAGFRPGDPVTTALDDPPTVEQLLNPATPRAKSPEFLHVEAVTNTEALRDAAIDVINRAARGDSALTVPGTEARNQIDKLFSPESVKANLRKLTETGMQENGLKYGRRVTDRSGALGLAVELRNARLVSIADDTGTENATTGGYKAGDGANRGHGVELVAAVNVPIKPNAAPPPAGQPSPPTGAGGFAVQGKWTPWSRSTATATEVGGSVDRNVVTPSGGRTVLIQLDADFTVVGESRSGNAAYGGTPRVEGARVTLPGGVFVRVSEDVARELGVLPEVGRDTPPPSFGTMAPPPSLTPGRPSSLGLSALEGAPDLSGLVTDLAARLNERTGGPFKSDVVPDSVLQDSMNNFQRLVDLTSPTSVKAMIDSALDGGVPLLVHQPGTFGKDSYQVTLKARVTGPPVFTGAVNDGIDVEHTAAGSRKTTGGLGRATGWGLGLKVPGTGQPGSANRNVSGGVGVIAAANVGQQHGSTTTRATTEQFGHLRAAGGPAAKYAVPVEFELVVERGDREIARTPARATTLGVRLHGDNQKVFTPQSQPPPDYTATATTRPPAEGTPEAAATWQRSGGPTALPPTASVENLRGAADLRAAAIRALTEAGAKQGITGKGTGALNTLLSTISSETLQANLPGMLDGPLEVPGLHEAALLFGQHAEVKVYAKLVNPRLGGLSDGVKLENPRSVVTTTSDEAKHTETGDVSVGWASGSAAVKPNPDPASTANFATGGVEVRHAAEDAEALSGGLAVNKTNNLKPQGRTGLVEFDVEYRVVATVGGRTGVVNLTVPGSAAVRMPQAEAEGVLGHDFGADLTEAQTRVKDAAKAWRDAEVAVDEARHGAQAVINEVAADLARLERDLDTARTRHDDALRTDLSEAARLPDLERAVRDAQQTRNTAGETVKELRRQVVELESTAQDAQADLDDADLAARTAARDLATADTAVETARTRLAEAQAALDALEEPTTEVVGARDARQSDLDAAADRAAEARQSHEAAVAARQQARQDAEAARRAADEAAARLAAAEQALDTARADLRTADEALTDGHDAARRAAEARDTAARERQRVEHEVTDLRAKITAAEQVLETRRTEAADRQRDWWNARIEVDQRIADYNRANTTPPAPNNDTPPPAPNNGTRPPAPNTGSLSPAPDNGATGNTPTPPMAQPQPPQVRTTPTDHAPVNAPTTDQHAPSEPLRLPPNGQTAHTRTPGQEVREEFAEPPRHTPVNPAISAPAPFAGTTAGVPQEHRAVAEPVVPAPVDEARRQLRLLADDVLPRLADPPPGTPPGGPVPPGTPPLIPPAPPAPDGLYHAVGQAVGIPAAALREQVVVGAPPERVSDFLLAHPMRRGHFHAALVESRNRSPRDGVEESMATNARDLAGRLIATRLGLNIAIHVPGAPRPVTLPPFGGPAAQTVDVRQVVANGVITYQWP